MGQWTSDIPLSFKSTYKSESYMILIHIWDMGQWTSDIQLSNKST